MTVATREIGGDTNHENNVETWTDGEPGDVHSGDWLTPAQVTERSARSAGATAKPAMGSPASL